MRERRSMRDFTEASVTLSPTFTVSPAIRAGSVFHSYSSPVWRASRRARMAACCCYVSGTALVTVAVRRACSRRSKSVKAASRGT